MSFSQQNGSRIFLQILKFLFDQKFAALKFKEENRRTAVRIMYRCGPMSERLLSASDDDDADDGDDGSISISNKNRTDDVRLCSDDDNRDKASVGVSPCQSVCPSVCLFLCLYRCVCPALQVSASLIRLPWQREAAAARLDAWLATYAYDSQLPTSRTTAALPRPPPRPLASTSVP